MNSKIWTGARFIAAVAMSYGLWGSTSVAVAQNCGAGCGPLVGNSCVKRSEDCGWLGKKIYPRMESRYIRQFCRATHLPRFVLRIFQAEDHTVERSVPELR